MTDPIEEPADFGEQPPDAKGQRLAKVIARSGLCSRREAERYIEQKRVQVDGKVIISPALNVTLDQIIVVDGQVIPDIEPTKLWRYHKPRGCLTTRHDPEGRATIYEYLPRQLQRLNAVGRLDFNSEGLLLLTNDGELVRQLTLPANQWLRRYRVRVHGQVDQGSLQRLQEGLTIDGIPYQTEEVTLDRQQGENAWLTISLREGKNREIRRLCEFFGWEVSRLLRLSFGPFQLGNLVKGEAEQIPGRVLRDQLGINTKIKTKKK